MAERVKHLGTAHQGGMLFWGGVKEFAGKQAGQVRLQTWSQPAFNVVMHSMHAFLV